MERPELSNSACLPSRAGGSPFFTSELPVDLGVESIPVCLPCSHFVAQFLDITDAPVDTF
jgi:hypothetical protein